jgi:hypothetical protein
MRQTTSDPYAVLGVPPNASQEQVRRAYHRLAKRYHPDLHPDAPSEQMRRVNQAWQALSSPGRRVWDDTGPARTGSPSSGHYDDNGPGWRTVLGAVAVGLLLFVVLFSGLLPAPLFGIVLLVAARSISGRSDR